jgi:hypothetical protein
MIMQQLWLENVNVQMNSRLFAAGRSHMQNSSGKMSMQHHTVTKATCRLSNHT